MKEANAVADKIADQLCGVDVDGMKEGRWMSWQHKNLQGQCRLVALASGAWELSIRRDGEPWQLTGKEYAA